jgi:hypothetical protein
MVWVRLIPDFCDGRPKSPKAGPEFHEKTMAKIRSKQVMPGMVLSSDVYDTSGRLLIKKGAVVDEKHLKVLSTWGVAEVEVESDDDVDDAVVTEIPQEFIEQASKQLRANLVHNDMEHELIKEVFDIAVCQLATSLMRRSKP